MMTSLIVLLGVVVSFAFVTNGWSSVSDNPPSYSEVGLSGVLNWTNSRLEWAENDFLSTHSSYFPSTLYWMDRTIYLIMVDRFNNGNLSNDNYNLPKQQAVNQNTSNLYDLPQYRHGGDIQGITDRLQYIHDLGIDTLWITPILQMDGSYHGYCTTYPINIDPGFGTMDEFINLVDIAHKKYNMSIILDIVVNHLCDSNDLYTSNITKYIQYGDHETCCSDKYGFYQNGDDWQKQSDHQGKLQFSDQWFPSLDSNEFYSQCGANSGSDTSGQGPCAVFGDFTASMIDYDTRNRDFQQIFTELHKFWIACCDIDGYRMDAAKHITGDFIEYFSTNIRDYAKSLGKDNFFIVGEVAASSDWEAQRLGIMMSNPKNPNDHDANLPGLITQEMWLLQNTYLNHSYQAYPGLTAIYDFDISGTAKSVFLSNSAPSSIQNYFNSNDYNLIAGQNNYSYSWTLCEIHDWPRFLNSIPSDWSVSIMAAAYLLTSQGMPIIYYGFEQGFNGVCNENNIKNVGNAYQDIINLCNSGNDDSLKRQDMFLYSPWRLSSAINSINDLSYIGSWEHKLSPPIDQDPFLNTTHSLYHNIQKLLFLRKSCIALRRGQVYFRYVDTTIGGWLIYSRIYNDIEILIVINTDHNNYKQMPQQIVIDYEINKSLNGKKYLNVLSPSTSYGYIGVGNGEAHLYFNNPVITIPSSGYAVFVREDQIGQYNEQYSIAFCVE